MELTLESQYVIIGAMFCLTLLSIFAFAKLAAAIEKGDNKHEGIVGRLMMAICVAVFFVIPFGAGWCWVFQKGCSNLLESM